MPQKTNSRYFCAGLSPRRERPRHRPAEHTEKCASLHVQPQAQEKASRRNDKNEHFGRGLEWTSGTGHCAARPMSHVGHGETSSAQSFLVSSSFNTRPLAAPQRNWREVPKPASLQINRKSAFASCGHTGRIGLGRLVPQPGSCPATNGWTLTRSPRRRSRARPAEWRGQVRSRF